MIRKSAGIPYSQETVLSENSLYAMGMMDDTQISQVITRLNLDALNQFSFVAMTEGYGFIKQSNSIHYKWFIDDKERNTFESDGLVGSAPTNGIVGANNQLFRFRSTDNFPIKQHHALCPDGSSLLYIHDVEKQADGGAILTVQIANGLGNAGIPASFFTKGNFFGLTFSAVPFSRSRGNSFRTKGVSRMYNQLTLSRYTTNIEGNMANKFYKITFSDNLDRGNYQETFVDVDRFRFDFSAKVKQNDALYRGSYNRDSNGRYKLIDRETGQPIPVGAGAREQVYENGTYETHAGKLSLEQLKAAVFAQYTNNNATEKINWLIQGGIGFGDLLSQALEQAGYKKGYVNAMGHFSITPNGDGLTLYNNFTAWEFMGNIIRWTEDAAFTSGTMAEVDIKNGRVVNGLPHCSYSALVMDYSMYGGEPNIFMVTEAGRAYQSYVVRGTTQVPAAWGGNVGTPVQHSASDEDAASYHVLLTSSICIKNPTKCVLFEMA